MSNIDQILTDLSFQVIALEDNMLTEPLQTLAKTQLKVLILDTFIGSLHESSTGTITDIADNFSKKVASL